MQTSGDRILRKGDRGKDVVQLKHDLQAWFDRAAPGVWQTFRVGPGPVFGAALASAVREFQMRNGLLVDGEVGDDTRAALARTTPAPKTKAKTKAGDRTDGILRRGDRGPEVTQLKRDLEAWFEHALPGSWESFGVAGGPGFGPGTRARRPRLPAAQRAARRRRGRQRDARRAPGAPPPPSPITAPRPDLPDLKLDAPKKPGSSGEKVRLIQGWLSLHGFKLVVDGGYGNATARQVRAFQKAKGLPVTGIVDEATYARLVQPMIAALSPIAPNGPLGPLVVAYARQHLVQHPQEAGGENRGPWVRLYTQGREEWTSRGVRALHVHPRAGLSRRRSRDAVRQDARLRRRCRRVPALGSCLSRSRHSGADHAGKLLPEAESPRREAEVRPHGHRGARRTPTRSRASRGTRTTKARPRASRSAPASTATADWTSSSSERDETETRHVGELAVENNRATSGLLVRAPGQFRSCADSRGARHSSSMGL